MRRESCLLSCLILLLALPLPASAVEEGLWRFDIRYELIGIPQTFPSYQKTQCITKEKPVPDISRRGHECKTHLRGTFGQMETWQIDCSNDAETTQGMGRIIYDKDKATGDVHIQIVSTISPPEFMVFYVQGKRLGACKK